MLKSIARSLDGIFKSGQIGLSVAIVTALLYFVSLAGGALYKEHLISHDIPVPEYSLTDVIFLFNILYIIGLIGCLIITWIYAKNIDEPVDKKGTSRESRRYTSIRSSIKVALFGYFGINFAVVIAGTVVLIVGGIISGISKTSSKIGSIIDKVIDKVLTLKI